MIPVNTPLLKGNELKYVTECIETGWISSEGPFIIKFEQNFSNYIGRKYGIAVSSGSAALDIVIKAFNFEKNSQIIIPSFTIICPTQSIISAGLIPVLVDSELTTWNMDVSQIEKKINSKTKAILVVHIYGMPVDMDPIIELCNKYNLVLIEDAAEMHGQTYKGKKCGTFGHASIFSFYPNKHITTGEGGMILCDDNDIAERARLLRNLAFNPNGRRFVHHELGWNYRMTNLQAALGVAQLENIEYHIIRKREIGAMYQDGLKLIKGIQLPIVKNHYAENIYWVFGLVADTEELATSIINKLHKNNIGTRPFFWPMHLQPVLNEMGLFINERYPISEQLAKCGFYIPSGLGLTNSDIKTVINTILE